MSDEAMETIAEILTAAYVIIGTIVAILAIVGVSILMPVAYMTFGVLAFDAAHHLERKQYGTGIWEAVVALVIFCLIH